MDIVKLVVGTLFGGGFVILPWINYQTRVTRPKTLSWPSAQGRIVVSEQYNKTIGESEYPMGRIKYVYKVGDSEYSGGCVEYGSVDADHYWLVQNYSVDMRVVVYYDPRSPSQAALKRPSDPGASRPLSLPTFIFINTLAIAFGLIILMVSWDVLLFAE